MSGAQAIECAKLVHFEKVTRSPRLHMASLVALRICAQGQRCYFAAYTLCPVQRLSVPSQLVRTSSAK